MSSECALLTVGIVHGARRRRRGAARACVWFAGTACGCNAVCLPSDSGRFSSVLRKGGAMGGIVLAAGLALSGEERLNGEWAAPPGGGCSGGLSCVCRQRAAVACLVRPRLQSRIA